MNNKIATKSVAISLSLAIAAVSLIFWILAPIFRHFIPADSLPESNQSISPIPVPEINEPSGPPPVSLPPVDHDGSIYVPPKSQVGDGR